MKQVFDIGKQYCKLICVSFIDIISIILAVYSRLRKDIYTSLGPGVRFRGRMEAARYIHGVYSCYKSAHLGNNVFYRYRKTFNSERYIEI